MSEQPIYPDNHPGNLPRHRKPTPGETIEPQQRDEIDNHAARIEQLEKALLSERQTGCATIAKQRYRIEQLEAERDQLEAERDQLEAERDKLKSKVKSLRKGHQEQQLGSKRLNESLGIVVGQLNELKDRIAKGGDDEKT